VSTSTRPLFLQYAQGNSFRNVAAKRGAYGGDHGVLLYGASFNDLTTVDASGFWYGILLSSGAADNLMVDLAVAASVQSGITLSASDRNVLYRVATSNNGIDGVSFQFSHQNTLLSVLAASNRGNGIELNGSKDNRIVHPTVVRNTFWGIWAQGASDANVILGAAVHDNPAGGVRFTDSSGNLVGDATIADNPNGGLYSEGTSQNRYTGLLRLGNFPSPDCSVVGGAPLPGFDPVTCQPSDPEGVLETGISLAASWVSAIYVDDAVNVSDADGWTWITQMDDLAFDWTHFEQRHRVWSRSVPPLAGALGCSLSGYRDQAACTTNGGTWAGDARIVDWTPRLGDFVAREVFGVPTPLDDRSHAWVYDPTPSSFLLHASERIGDLAGDDDGLCEAGERCLTSPNVGAYQGHGVYTYDGTYDIGTVGSVSLYFWSINGR
jgi:hypothetical protein